MTGLSQGVGKDFDGLCTRDDDAFIDDETGYASDAAARTFQMVIKADFLGAFGHARVHGSGFPAG